VTVAQFSGVNGRVLDGLPIVLLALLVGFAAVLGRPSRTS